MSGARTRTVTSNAGLTAGVVIVVGLLAAAFLAPLPHDPLEPDAAATLVHPGNRFWFGTDTSGFDVFSRTIRAGRLDLPLALIGTLLSMAIGVPIGLFASGRGKVSEGAMRGLDIFQAFPLLILALVIVALTGNHLPNIVIAIALINVPTFIRLVRSQTLSLREARFIEAARSIGASDSRVMLKHVLPNVSAPIAAQAAITAAQSIVVIAAMTFLGIGITPPTASWGAMIQTGSANMSTGEWWVAAFPGIAILVIVVSFHLIADGIQRLLDPTAHG